MGERKVVSKYIPADFDPSLVPRGKKLSSKDGTVPVRMMLPFSIQCSTCHTFLYRGRKFNSKKEPMGGPDGKYLGITRFRFYIKCSSCARPITFLTDPQHADYEMESGGTRNYEVYKDKAKTEEEFAQEQEEEEKDDPMKALENRVVESQKEMADLDNLEEIKAMNARHVKLLNASGDPVAFEAETKALLAKRDMQEEEAARKKGGEFQKPSSAIELTEEDEALVKSIQFGKRKQASSSLAAATAGGNKNFVRLDDRDEERIELERKRKMEELEEQQKQQQASLKKKKTSIPVIMIKKKRQEKTALPRNMESQKLDSSAAEAAAVDMTASSSANTNGGGLAGLLGGYSSSSDDE